MRNPSGEKALLNDNPDTPNERYFEYLDWILNTAEEYGFYVLLLPVWGQLVVGSDWGGSTYEKTITEENAYRYGQWIETVTGIEITSSGVWEETASLSTEVWITKMYGAGWQKVSPKEYWIKI